MWVESTKKFPKYSNTILHWILIYYEKKFLCKSSNYILNKFVSVLLLIIKFVRPILGLNRDNTKNNLTALYSMPGCSTYFWFEPRQYRKQFDSFVLHAYHFLLLLLFLRRPKWIPLWEEQNSIVKRYCCFHSSTTTVKGRIALRDVNKKSFSQRQQ